MIRRDFGRWSVWTAAGVTAAALIVVATLVGQSRDGYEQAYRDWRARDPGLEKDSAKAGDALAARTDQAAAAVGKFVTARKAFYDSQRDDLAEKLKALQHFEIPKEMDGAKGVEASLASQQTSDANSILVFANDPDKGIQQLRQAMEKENQALLALSEAIKARESARQAVDQADARAEDARSAAVNEIQSISESFEQSSQGAGQMAEAWPAYYRSLAEGARAGGGVSEATRAPVIRPPDSTPSATSPAPVSSTRAAPPVLVSRFTGAWAFVPGVSTYHGLAPLAFDVVVREEGGQIRGTVNARFVITGSADPNMRFDFSGPLQSARYQAFPLRTPDGAKGTVELIPGNAFNLLEVNYTIDGAPGKVAESDVILVKR
jgi:hypothetical protein